MPSHVMMPVTDPEEARLLVSSTSQGSGGNKPHQLSTNLGFYGSHPSGNLLSVSRCDPKISTAGLKSYCYGFSNHFRVCNHDIHILFFFFLGGAGGEAPLKAKCLILILYIVSFSLRVILEISNTILRILEELRNGGTRV